MYFSEGLAILGVVANPEARLIIFSHSKETLAVVQKALAEFRVRALRKVEPKSSAGASRLFNSDRRTTECSCCGEEQRSGASH